MKLPKNFLNIRRFSQVAEESGFAKAKAIFLSVGKDKFQDAPGI